MKQRNVTNDYDRLFGKCLGGLEVVLARLDFVSSALAKAGKLSPTTKRRLHRVTLQVLRLLMHLEGDFSKEVEKDRKLRRSYEWARRRFTDRQLKHWLSRLPDYQEGDGLSFAQVLGPLESVGKRSRR